MPALAQDASQSRPRSLPAPPVAAPAAPPLPADAATAEVIINSVSGIAFVPAGDSAPLTDGIDVARIPMLDTAAFRASLAARLGRPASLADLNAIAREAVLAHRAGGRPLVDVSIPEQDVSAGRVRFVVSEFRVGQVLVEGNRHVPAERIREAIRLAPGDVVYQPQLVQDLEWLATNPFRRVDIIYRRGEAPFTTDVIARVQDRSPLRAYAGFENNGQPATQRGRLFAGINWGAMFGGDGQAAYQYTTSPDLFDRRGGRGVSFQAHAVTLLQPLAGRSSILAFGTWQRVRPDLGPFFDVAGENWQLSLRYSRIVARGATLSIGYDFKQSDNDLLFGGTSVSAQATRIHQLVLDLTTTARLAGGGSITFGGTAFLSPGGIGARNSDGAFQPGAAQAGVAFARATYAYARGTINAAIPIAAGFEARTRLTGQISTGNLLPSEQLAIAGPGFVRGYDPNAVLGAQGLTVSQEVFAPAFSLGTGRDEGRVGAFFDAGMAGNPDRLPGEPRWARTTSAGLTGLFALSPYVQLRLDYGWQLRTLPGASRRGQIGFISATAGF